MQSLEQASSTIWASLNTFITTFLELLPRISIGVLFLCVFALALYAGLWGLRIACRRARMRRSLVDVFTMLARVIGWGVGLLIAFTIVFPSIDPADALTALGLGSVAIGFAFKGFLENFLAGVMILLREPFRVGDFIKSGSIDGKIEAINMREANIRQTDGQRIVVPNSHFYMNPVTVRTDQEFRRTSIICGVAYREDPDRAREVIYEAVKHVDMVRDDVRDVQVFAKEFNSSSLDFEIAWWTGSTPLDIRQSRDGVVRAIKKALTKADIEIPFPYRTLITATDQVGDSEEQK